LPHGIGGPLADPETRRSRMDTHKRNDGFWGAIPLGNFLPHLFFRPALVVLDRRVLVLRLIWI